MSNVVKMPVRLLFVLSVVMLSACASSEPDRLYLHSEQRPALKIPVGLATPAYNEQMQVSEEKASDVASPRADSSLTEDSLALERPPILEESE